MRDSLNLSASIMMRITENQPLTEICLNCAGAGILGVSPSSEAAVKETSRSALSILSQLSKTPSFS